jgi:hypothetical protein
MALKDLSLIEREIIGRYIDRVEAMAKVKYRDMSVIIRDEEGAVYVGPFNRGLIEIQIGNTDVTKVSVQVSDIERHTVLFIHGNEEDVVSDSGYTEMAEWMEEELLKGVYS